MGDGETAVIGGLATLALIILYLFTLRRGVVAGTRFMTTAETLLGKGDLMASIMAITAKRGRIVITNVHPWNEPSNNIPLIDLTLSEKQVVGSLYGSANPRSDIPRLAELYRKGQLDLDSMITRTYTLDQINEGYQDMRDGKNIRGVIIH